MHMSYAKCTLSQQKLCALTPAIYTFYVLSHIMIDKYYSTNPKARSYTFNILIYYVKKAQTTNQVYLNSTKG